MTFSNLQQQQVEEEMEVPRLDLVFDDSDHDYAKESSEWSRGTAGAWGDTIRGKRIRKEWKFLKQHLPQVQGIYVQLYVTRLDLMRVAIVGPPGTPYHDGLFFFDIAIPPGYPDKAPLVHYKSFGYRVNPCFDGWAALGFLNSGSGLGSVRMTEYEMWEPPHSNIFQLLLSIQALVLNDEPYFNSTRLRTSIVQALVRKEQLLFNKPIHGAYPNGTYWKEKSLAYNEKVFIRCCKTMVIMIQNPPKNCERLIKQHFRDRAEFILRACNSYRKGLVKVGKIDAEAEKGFEEVEVSSKFKVAMDRVYPEVARALKTTGAPPVWFLFVDEHTREESERRMPMLESGVKTFLKKKLQLIEFGQSRRRTTLL